MNDTFEELGKKLADAAENVAGKTSDWLEIQKLKNQIRTLERGNMRDYADIGKMYYEKYKVGEVIDADAGALCENISNREMEIAGLEQQVDSRKDTW